MARQAASSAAESAMSKAKALTHVASGGEHIFDALSLLEIPRGAGAVSLVNGPDPESWLK
jgi:hypothetical protein